jgi:hypothetical protein
MLEAASRHNADERKAGSIDCEGCPSSSRGADKRRRPYCLSARGTPAFLSLPPAHAEGMERREAPHQLRLSARALCEGRCAPRRSIAVSYGVRAALSAAFPASPSALKPDPFRSIEPFGPRARRQHAPSASSWRGVLLPPGGAPAPPERMGCVHPHARGHRALFRRRDASRRRPQPNKAEGI